MAETSVTVAQTITRALRKTKVIGEGETATAEQAADALLIFNSMMFAFTKSHIFASHTTKASGDTLGVDDDAVEFVTSSLAVRLAHEYGTEPSVIDLSIIERDKKLLYAANTTVEEVTSSSGLVGTNVTFDMINGA